MHDLNTAIANAAKTFQGRKEMALQRAAQYRADAATCREAGAEAIAVQHERAAQGLDLQAAIFGEHQRNAEEGFMAVISSVDAHLAGGNVGLESVVAAASVANRLRVVKPVSATIIEDGVANFIRG